MLRYFFGYVNEYLSEFEREHLSLSRRFADTIDVAYNAYAWMPDDRFRDAITNTLNAFI